ncbi:hypothetical protein STRDD13_01453 [Streptococcus sp. DD13]|nr:hypothetical protein STRDD13_01453 [Streptococcus sp. DD13]
MKGFIHLDRAFFGDFVPDLLPIMEISVLFDYRGSANKA